MCLSLKERHITVTEYQKRVVTSMKKFVICILATVILLVGCASETTSKIHDETSENGNSDSKNNLTNTLGDISGTSLSLYETTGNDAEISESEKEICWEAAGGAYDSKFPDFNADSIIQIDDIILYYELHMIRGEKGALLSELEQYHTGRSFFEIRIPKKEVRNALQPLFSPHIEDTYSKYEDPADSDYLILDAEVRGHLFVRCNSYTRKNDIIEMEVEGGWVDPFPESGDGLHVHRKFILGVKLLGESDYMYMYYNSIENVSQEE